MHLGVKSQPCPLFISKVQRDVTFTTPDSFLCNVLRQGSPEAANKRMPEKSKAIERGEPEGCSDCECPNNHATLLAVKYSLLAWKC